MAETVNTPSMGQRLTWSFDIHKSFKHKQEPINGVDSTEIDLVRVYQLVLPYGAPFEETYVVLDEIKAEIKKIEVIAKEQEAQRKAATESKEMDVDIEESSIS
jgi:predicted RNase H-like nuclease